MAQIQWIAVDWGATQLEAFAVNAVDGVVAKTKRPCTAQDLPDARFEPVLLEALSPWLCPSRSLPVVVCGAPHRSDIRFSEVPCVPIDPETVVQLDMSDSRLTVTIVPGLCQRWPEDVMFGPEAKIAGFLQKTPDFSGVVCCTGSHAKWVEVDEGRVTAFTSYMTGEMFALLSEQSALGDWVDTEEWDDLAFLKSVEEGLRSSHGWLARLVGLRARGLLTGSDRGTLRSQLSGMLVGAEMAATRPLWTDRDVVIIGEAELSRLYQIALSTRGCQSEIVDATSALVTGLWPYIAADVPRLKVV